MNIGLSSHVPKKRPRMEYQYGKIVLEFDRHPGHEHMKTRSTLPCRIDQDKIYTMTRTFCRKTLKLIKGSANDKVPMIGISYSLNN